LYIGVASLWGFGGIGKIAPGQRACGDHPGCGNCGQVPRDTSICRALVVTFESFGSAQEHAMAKGQMRQNKEKKKPKADHNKDKKKGGLPPHLQIQQGGGQAGSNPFKKT
jgi:hypothetical protein